MKYFGKLAVLGAALAVSASSAYATLITPGQTGLAVASLSSFTGGTLVGSTAGTLSTADFSSSWSESVYTGASSSTLCPACYEFVFNFGPTSGSDVVQAAMSYFKGFTTDVYYVTGTGVAPLDVSEAANGTITFDFDVTSGHSADELVILTNALTDYTGIFGLQDGSNASAPDFGPAVAPEPSSLMLLGTGLLGAAGMLMRRRQQQTAV